MSGIVRRIDELGRIVIPKEIRKTLRIKEGEMLEISTSEDKIVLKKYSEFKNFKENANKILNVLSRYLTYDFLLSDRDHFILGTGPLKREYLDKEISPMLESFIESHDAILKIENDEFVFTNESVLGNFLVVSIHDNGDILGLLIVDFQDDKITEEKQELLKIIADLLAKDVAE